MLKIFIWDRINTEKSGTIFYFGTDSFGGARPKNLAIVGTMATVNPRRSGSVNLVITHDMANVPTGKLEIDGSKSLKTIQFCPLCQDIPLWLSNQVAISFVLDCWYLEISECKRISSLFISSNKFSGCFMQSFFHTYREDFREYILANHDFQLHSQLSHKPTVL